MFLKLHCHTAFQYVQCMSYQATVLLKPENFVRMRTKKGMQVKSRDLNSKNDNFAIERDN
jgi:hypothetical protein